MSRPKTKEPKYCQHKRSGHAFVTIDGKEHWLGPYGSQDSRDKYARKIGEWIGRNRQPEPAPETDVVRVTDVCAAFWAHAQTVYPDPDYREGKRPKGELGNYWDVLRPLRRLYGETPAAGFGPVALKAVRAAMLQAREVTDPTTGKGKAVPGWCRNVANRHVSRIKSIFRWAAEEELVAGEVAAAVWAVKGLRSGRSDARESEPVRSVPEEYVLAVLPLVSRQVKTMIQLQLLTGMRPGEVCAMRTREIDTAGKVWVYRPSKHKTAHHGHVREIRLGPKAQELLGPFLKIDLDACCFSPAEAEAERREAQRTAREKPVRPWEHRQDKARVAAAGGRRRPPKARYSVPTYRKAIARACAKADKLAHQKDPTLAKDLVVVPAWHPHQLRHTAATRLRREFGLEAAQVILGHRTLAVTQIYAEKNAAAAEEVMGRIG
jgi:integrase